MPRNPAVHPPRQPVTTTICCVCNKKFSSSVGLSSHQNAKRHYPPKPASPRKLVSSNEPALQRKPPGVSSAVNGNPIANKLDVAGQRVIHRCNECQATFDSLAQLDTHRSAHGKISCSKCSYIFSSLAEWNNHFELVHRNTQPGSRQGEIAPEAITSPFRVSSPAIARPASSQSISNKSVSPNSHGKGQVICNICKKPFKGQAGLQAHTDAKHSTRAECVICHFICPSTAALEEHVDSVHSCAVCHDGILRDVRTLSDHMMEHSHPVPCKRCGTRYRTEEERKLHFADAGNDHPVCAACRLGLEDDDALCVVSLTIWS